MHFYSFCGRLCCYLDIEGDDLVLKLEGSNLPPVTCKLEEIVPLPEDTSDINKDDIESGKWP